MNPIDPKVKEIAEALLKLPPEKRMLVIAAVQLAESLGTGGKRRGRPPANGAADPRQSTIEESA